MELTGRQWITIEPLDPREVLNGFYRHCGPVRRGKSCRRRFRQWVKAGVFRRVVEALAAELQERGGLDIRGAFLDGGFVPAEKGGLSLAGQNAA
ncbi:hypothetical protein VU07_00345 [Desulfobulbus sp. F4]|nr:hypothetical protein [Desulfobulbus sp. F4]